MTDQCRFHGYSMNDSISDPKCASITEDRLDSGIGSLTPSDVERNRSIDRKVEEETSEQVDSLLSMDQVDSGIEKSLDKLSLDSGLSFKKEVSPSELPSREDLLSREDSPYKRSEIPYANYVTDEKSGFSCLHNAILDENITEVIRLIHNSPEAACLDFFTSEIHTSLHLAVYVNLPQIVRFLVVYGAKLTSTDRQGNSPLHTACELGRLQCVRMILSPLDEEENIGLQQSNVPQDVNEKNFEGLTPLHLATINNHPEVVSFLLTQPGIDANIGDSTSGRTALHHALERRHKECFRRLLKSSVDVNATTYDGCSPLHLAVGLELEQETRYLMTQGANAQIATTDEIKAWDLARSQKIKDALQYSTLIMQNQSAIKQR